MSKTVILEDEEIEILLSYHKERLAHAAAEIQSLSEKKEASEKRLQELAAVHEHESEVAAETLAGEPEGLHLTEDGVLAEEHLDEPEAAFVAETEAVVEMEETAEPGMEEAVEIQNSVEPTGVHHLEYEVTADEHEAEPETAHSIYDEAEQVIASAEVETEPGEDEETVHEHSDDNEELLEKHSDEPAPIQERYKGTFPA